MTLGLDQTLNILRAAGEESRLRLLVLLRAGELTVSELTQVLGQSQPRVSRHLKILSDAGLVERYREGAWVFYRLNDRDTPWHQIAELVETLSNSDDRTLVRDGERLGQVHIARAETAAAYFEDNAAQWDELRKLHLPEKDIEQAMLEMVGAEKIPLFIDLGTGTGRMLELFADRYEEGIGYDLSREMLSIARANIERAALPMARLRQGDLLSLPDEWGRADFVCMHQVLHFLGDPGSAVREAARLIKAGGRLLIADFAPHELEFLREEHAHRRLGFSDEEVSGWMRGAGLRLVKNHTLAPNIRSKGRLTVKLWMCEKVDKSQKQKAQHKKTQKAAG